MSVSFGLQQPKKWDTSLTNSHSKSQRKKITGFHKSAAAIRLRVEVAQREDESATVEEEREGGIEYRQRNPKDGGRDSGAENGMLSPSPEEEELFATHPSTSSYQILSP